MRRLIWIFIIILLLAGVAFAAWHFLKPARPAAPVDTSPIIVSAEYRCNGGKSISVAEHSESATVTLSDGRSFTLPFVPATNASSTASGSRYATETGSIVFWVKEYSAFFEESGQTTYQGCVVHPLPF
jgi:membrane-bound inhibitor of C-type lysozyme